MSDELDWELGDMFDNGLFAFPVYEQNSARRVVRYLLKRGVPDEEIASAIQGSTIDLHAWLNRRGKPMFGEWAMAWMNETRDMHQSLNQRRPNVYRNGSLNDSDTFSRDSCSGSDDSDSDGSDYFRPRPEADEDSLASSVYTAFSGSTLDVHSDIQFRRRGVTRQDVATDSFTSVRSFDLTKDTRTPGSRSGVIELRTSGLVTHSTDSGNVSDLCSCRSKSSSFRKDFNVKVKYLTEATLPCQDDRGQGDLTPAAPVDCKCKLAHYIRRQKTTPSTTAN